MPHFPGHTTEETQRVRLEGAGLPVPDSIDSSVLKPVSDLDFQVPEPETVFPVATLKTPPLEPTAPEIQATDLTNELIDLNTQLLGESELRTKEEEKAGIPELTATQKDLEVQLQTLINEAKAIPLQLQAEAKGRGITVGGLRPIETGRLRTNAIAALGVASLLEASRGNLATALDLVDRAVAQKFDPIKEEIAVKRANLELILASPEFSLAKKNRAQAQLDTQNNQLLEIERQEAEDRALQEVLVNGVARGADALTLRQAKASDDIVEATRILTEAGFGEESRLGKILSVSEAKSLGVPFGTTEEQAFGITPQTTKGDGKDKVFGIKDLPGNIRNDIIDDLQNKDFAQTTGELTLDTLSRIYPEVNLDALRELMDEFYDFDALVEGTDVGKDGGKKWWQFWK